MEGRLQEGEKQDVSRNERVFDKRAKAGGSDRDVGKKNLRIGPSHPLEIGEIGLLLVTCMFGRICGCNQVGKSAFAARRVAAGGRGGEGIERMTPDAQLENTLCDGLLLGRFYLGGHMPSTLGGYLV